MDNLHITIIQPDIIWENKEENLKQYEKMFESIRDIKHLLVLPEMFTTGFTMNPSEFAEEIGGNTTKWMLKMAEKHECTIIGSIITEENGKYYNRLYCIQPNGIVDYYDKKHLFAFAGEYNNYTAGKSKTIVDYFGWKINLMICYDLRFPVWSKNTEEYDVLLYVANWPEQRSRAWKTLLQARSIENQCYTIGVNRVGKDGKGNNYSGDSSVIGPLGDVIWQNSGHVTHRTIIINKAELTNMRKKFPFLKDSDKFDFI